MLTLRTIRSVIRHKFSPRQSLLIIAVSIAVAFAANRLAVASDWSNAGVNAAGLAAAFATAIPLQVVFYRRTHV